MRKGLILLFVLTVLCGCSAGHNENPKAVVEEFKIGEVVWVCGCPMMCCQSISRDQNGRCSCNFPLKKGTVSKVNKVKSGKVYVQVSVSGREKVFFIKN
jgi:hypothetical protein